MIKRDLYLEIIKIQTISSTVSTLKQEQQTTNNDNRKNESFLKSRKKFREETFFFFFAIKLKYLGEIISAFRKAGGGGAIPRRSTQVPSDRLCLESP